MALNDIQLAGIALVALGFVEDATVLGIIVGVITSLAGLSLVLYGSLRKGRR